MGKLTASLDTAHYKGPISKSVQVRTDDPEQRPVTLLLKADIVTAVDVTPTDRPVLRAPAGTTTPLEVTVASADGKPFDVLAVEADPRLVVAVKPAGTAAAPKKKAGAKSTAVASGAARYTVSIAPKADVPIGQSTAYVNLATSVKKAEKVPINLVLTIVGPLEASPSRLLIAPATEPPVLHVRVRRHAGGAVKILGVESNDPDFAVTTTPIEDGKAHDVTVRYVGKPGRGPVSGRIVIRTDEPRQPELVIPLSGRV
ncbi:MAG TPA: hypothetical protein VKA21_12060 [Candidatus Binatia bacterium]|nr:hypothetical protein [Candidatus Binatia bacterium]